MSRYSSIVRQHLASRASVMLMKILPRLEASGKLDWGLMTLATVAQKIPNAGYQKVQLEQFREAIKNQHPVRELARRAVTDLHPKFVTGILRNLWMPFWINADTRRRFREQEGFDAPFLAVISPTKECNLQCRGCYANAIRGQQVERLDFDAIDKIVSELKSFGTSFIVFSGGEPTHPQMWPIIKEICLKHREMAFMMYTNGTMIDDRKIEDMMEMGNLSPAISIEGWREQTDDRRGSGVYDRIMAAMDLMHEAGIFFGFSLTYTSRNFEAATDPALIDHLMDKGCLYGWYFMYVPVGSNPDLSLLVEPWQRDQIRRFTWDVLRQKGMFIADFWNSGPMTRGCLAASKYLHINNRGEIEPCVFFKYSCHNVRDSSILDALRSPLFAQIREGQLSQGNPLTPCQFMDHPHNGMKAAAVPNAVASEEFGGKLFDGKALEFLEGWSKEYREQYADPAWLQSGDYAWFDHVYGPEERWLSPGLCPSTQARRTAAQPIVSDSAEPDPKLS